MSARDEFPIVPANTLGGAPSIMSRVPYEAMCDRIDTLTGQNAELKAEYEAQTGELTDAVIDFTHSQAELRSIRAAVAKWAYYINQTSLGSPHRSINNNTLAALVPSDGSWEGNE